MSMNKRFLSRKAKLYATEALAFCVDPNSDLRMFASKSCVPLARMEMFSEILKTPMPFENDKVADEHFPFHIELATMAHLSGASSKANVKAALHELLEEQKIIELHAKSSVD